MPKAKTRRKPSVAKKPVEQEEHQEDNVSEAEKIQLRKLKDMEVEACKGGKLVEVRRIGVKPIFIKVTKTDTVREALETADIPTHGDEELKIEGVKNNQSTWVTISLGDKIFSYDRIAITTKVDGA